MSKQKVQLQAGAQDSVFVEDVDVSKGVYCTIISNYYVTKNKSGFNLITTDGVLQERNAQSLRELMTLFDTIKFYTLSGQRITTEKVLTVGDLTNGDHVGWMYGDNKAYVINIGNGKYMSATTTKSAEIDGVCNDSFTAVNSLYDCIKDRVTEIYKFTTRKELYAWLAE